MCIRDSFDVDVDPNWPDYKMFKNVPPGAAVGDVLRLGNGEGWRADAVVVERDGAIADILGGVFETGDTRQRIADMVAASAAAPAVLGLSLIHI